jgi:hypothetical protein
MTQATLRLSSEEDLQAFREFKEANYAGMTNSAALSKLINDVKSTQTEELPMKTENVMLRLTNKLTLTNFQALKDIVSKSHQQRYTNDGFQQLLLDSFMKNELKIETSVSESSYRLRECEEHINDLYNKYDRVMSMVSRLLAE